MTSNPQLPRQGRPALRYCRNTYRSLPAPQRWRYLQALRRRRDAAVEPAQPRFHSAHPLALQARLDMEFPMSLQPPAPPEAVMATEPNHALRQHIRCQLQKVRPALRAATARRAVATQLSET